MKKKTKSVFGDTISIPDNLAVGFSVALQVDGTVHENYGRETCYLAIKLSTGGPLQIEKTFMVAKGTDG